MTIRSILCAMLLASGTAPAVAQTGMGCVPDSVGLGGCDPRNAARGRTLGQRGLSPAQAGNGKSIGADGGPSLGLGAAAGTPSVLPPIDPQTGQPSDPTVWHPAPVGGTPR